MLVKQFEECHIKVNEKEMSKLEKISDGNGRISKYNLLNLMLIKWSPCKVCIMNVHISQRWVYQLCQELRGCEGVPGEERPGEQLEARPSATRRVGAEHGQGERRLQSHRQGQQRLRGQGGVPAVYQVICMLLLLQVCWNSFYSNLPKHQQEKLLKKIDSDGDGKVSLKEFRQLFEKQS